MKKIEELLSPSEIEFLDENRVDRWHTDSKKWDGLKTEFGKSDLIPMWIADMDFKTVAAVRSALVQRAENGAFGYTYTPEDYFPSFAKWMRERHQTVIKSEWLRFDFGVVNSIYMLINALTNPQDKVVLMPPVYYPFANAIKDTHRTLVSVPLLGDADCRYDIDFESLEATFRDEHPKVMIFCSPHNPVGRIWSEEELKNLLRLCREYQVQLISDEIHQDFEIGNDKFVSVLSVAGGEYQKDVIVLNAPTKTFNLANLLISHVLIPDPVKRAHYDAYFNAHNKISNSGMGQLAGVTAYENGADWLDHVLKIVKTNYDYMVDNLTTIKGVKFAPLEGTYLAWLDLRAVVDPADIHDFIQNKVGLAVDYGEWFGEENDDGIVRLNLATDPKLVQEATERLYKALTEQQKNA